MWTTLIWKFQKNIKIKLVWKNLNVPIPKLANVCKVQKLILIKKPPNIGGNQCWMVLWFCYDISSFGFSKKIIIEEPTSFMK